MEGQALIRAHMVRRFTYHRDNSVDTRYRVELYETTDAMPGGLEYGEAMLDDRQRVGVTRVKDRVTDLRQLVKIALSLHQLRLHALRSTHVHAPTDSELVYYSGQYTNSECNR